MIHANTNSSAQNQSSMSPTDLASNNTISNLGLSSKPKRKRRSYNCGQCKSLKIKCDLKIPCSSCIKFNRVEKCMLNPPHPPSNDELTKMRIRKSRSDKRKQQLRNQNQSQSHQLHDYPHHLPYSNNFPSQFISPIHQHHHQHQPQHHQLQHHQHQPQPHFHPVPPPNYLSPMHHHSPPVAYQIPQTIKEETSPVTNYPHNASFNDNRNTPMIPQPLIASQTASPAPPPLYPRHASPRPIVQHFPYGPRPDPSHKSPIIPQSQSQSPHPQPHPHPPTQQPVVPLTSQPLAQPVFQPTTQPATQPVAQPVTQSPFQTLPSPFHSRQSYLPRPSQMPYPLSDPALGPATHASTSSAAAPPPTSSSSSSSHSPLSYQPPAPTTYTSLPPPIISSTQGRSPSSNDSIGSHQSPYSKPFPPLTPDIASHPTVTGTITSASALPPVSHQSHSLTTTTLPPPISHQYPSPRHLPGAHTLPSAPPSAPPSASPSAPPSATSPYPSLARSILNPSSSATSSVTGSMVSTVGRHTPPNTSGGFNKEKLSNMLPTRKNKSTITSIHLYSFLQDQYRHDSQINVELPHDTIATLVKFRVLQQSTLCQLFYRYISSCSVYDEPVIDTDTIFDKLRDGFSNTDSTTMDLFTARYLCLGLLIMMNGLLLGDHKSFDSQRIIPGVGPLTKSQLVSQWWGLASSVNEKLPIRNDVLADAIYSIQWFLIMANFHSSNATIVQNYDQFNKLLSMLQHNNQFMQLCHDKSDQEFDDAITRISNGESKPGQDFETDDKFRAVNIAWCQVRLAELKYPYFQIKGSLLNSPEFKNAMLPHQKMIRVVYDDSILRDDHRFESWQNFQMQIWAAYYRRFDKCNSIQEIISSYLYLYKDVADLVQDRMAQLDTKLLQHQRLNDDDVSLIIQNQMVLNLSVRWLSFVKLESSYFASLRFSSYIIAMLVVFNAYNKADDAILHRSEGTQTLNQILYRNFGLPSLHFLFESLIFQGVFLLVLKRFCLLVQDQQQEQDQNHKHEHSHSHLINLQQLYDKVNSRFRTVLRKCTDEKRDGSSLVVAEDEPEESLNLNEEIKYEQMHPHADHHSFPSQHHQQSAEVEDWGAHGAANIPYLRKILRLCHLFVKILDTHDPSASKPSYTLQDLITTIETSINKSSWSFLTSGSFGSVDNLVTYTSRVWEMFRFLSNSTPTTRVMITKTLTMSQGLIDDYSDRLTGFHSTSQVIDEYMEEVVARNLQDLNSFV